jgi:hypothetical protein
MGDLKEAFFPSTEEGQVRLQFREAPHASRRWAEAAGWKLYGYDEPTGECRKSAESAGKVRLDLVPTAAVEQVAAVLTFGARKYGDNNWCRGARWGRYYAAALRHVFAWWRGEDRDPETGLSHLAHAVCCLLFLMEYQDNGWGADDRFREPDGGEFKKADGG